MIYFFSLDYFAVLCAKKSFMRKIILLLLISNVLFAQKIVPDLQSVKSPKNGKLYFSEKENKLAVFANKQFYGIFQAPKDTTPTPPPPPPVEKETVAGYWSSPDRILVAYELSGYLWLMQRDPAGSYYVSRGRNLLLDNASFNNGKLSQSQLSGGDTGLGGLYKPDSFPESKFLQETGRVKNSDGEYVFAKPDPNPGGGGSTPGKLNRIPKYPLPDRNNWTVFENFPEIKIPEGITTIGGYGFPLYKNEGLSPSGKLSLFSKGYTNVVNTSALPRSSWSGENSYSFNQVFHLLKEAAKIMVRSGNTGPEFGNIEQIASLPADQHYIPYSGITVKGAIELGKNIFYSVCCSNSIDDPSYNIPLNKGALMLDEESMTHLSWVGGDHYSFLGYLTQGIREAAGPDYKILWYAQPIQRWFQNTVINGIDWVTKSSIESSFSPSNITLSSPGWMNSSWHVDANGAYSKVTFLSKTRIYKERDGKILLGPDGKRQFRSDQFSVDAFGKSFSILPEPHEWIKYSIQNSTTGEMKFGSQYFDIYPNGASVKKEWTSKGYGLPANGLARPNPGSWEPESKMWVDGIYRRADGIMADLLALSWLEKGNYDISKSNSKYKLYGEHRPKTEPWTFGGNDINSREVGESQIFYDTYMLLYSGGSILSTWDDGYFKNELPNKGGVLYDSDDYWGRYHARLAAIQSALKPLEGTKVKDWTYIHFYYPYWGFKNSEVISSGIYHNGKLHLFFLNPTLEDGEAQKLTLEYNGKKLTYDLIGHEFYTLSLDVGIGLAPSDFKLSYTTIYGRKVKVNGVVTSKIDDHYEQ